MYIYVAAGQHGRSFLVVVDARYNFTIRTHKLRRNTFVILSCVPSLLRTASTEARSRCSTGIFTYIYPNNQQHRLHVHLLAVNHRRVHHTEINAQTHIQSSSISLYVRSITNNSSTTDSSNAFALVILFENLSECVAERA